MIKQKDQWLYTTEEVNELLSKIETRISNIEISLENSGLDTEGNTKVSALEVTVQDLAWQIYKPKGLHKIYLYVNDLIRRAILRTRRTA